MEPQVIEQKLKTIATQLDEKFKKVEEENTNIGKAHKDTLNEIKALAQKHTELSTKLEDENKKLADTIKQQQKHMDEMDIKLQQFNEKSGSKFSLVENIKAGIDKNKEQIIANKEIQAPVQFKLDYKAVADMGSSTHLTGEVVPAYRVPGMPFYDPANPVRIRELMNVGTMTSNQIRFLRESGGEGGAAMVAEAGSKPQIDKDITTVERSVRKIASHFRVPEEMMDDIPFLQSYLVTRGLDDLKDVEDSQLLTGDNTGENLDGIIPNAATYVDAFTLANATALDVLRFAVNQVFIKHYRATAILMHPTEIAKLSILKDSQGRYLNESIYSGIFPNIGGVPLIGNTAIAEDAFLVGDFRRGAFLWDRMSANVRFYDQDRDNAIANMITIVIEERLCNTIYRPNAFVKSTGLAAAVTAAQS